MDILGQPKVNTKVKSNLPEVHQFSDLISKRFEPKVIKS